MSLALTLWDQAPQERAGASELFLVALRPPLAAALRRQPGPWTWPRLASRAGLQSGLLLLLLGWSLLPLGHKILLFTVLVLLMAAPEQQLQVSAGALALQGLGATITSGMEGLEGHMQGDAREAEGKA